MTYLHRHVGQKHTQTVGLKRNVKANTGEGHYVKMEETVQPCVEGERTTRSNPHSRALTFPGDPMHP